MALHKAIKQEDGVITKYHRILFLQSTINRQNSIVVISYIDDEARNEEKQAMDSVAYKKSKTYEIDYDPTMTIESAYEYLKTLEEYNGANDI